MNRDNIREIQVKPWGNEELLEINDSYLMKRLYMRRNQCCSLQYHRKKHESILVISGKLQIEYGDDKRNLETFILLPGSTIDVPPGVIHRMKGLEDTVYIECSTPELKDVIRLEDKYGRVE